MAKIEVESHILVGVTSFQLSFQHPFRSMSIDPSIPQIQNFLNLTFRTLGHDEMTVMLHNYRFRQFHITSNVLNPSSGFREMASTKSGPSAASFDKFWAMGKPMWGKWPNYYDSAHRQVKASP